MKYANINLGEDVEIDPSTSLNNVIIGDNVRIAKRCSIYGGPDNLLEIGSDTYVGMNRLLNGYAAKLDYWKNVSIAQNVNIMVDSGPNASSCHAKCVSPGEEAGDNRGSWLDRNRIYHHARCYLG